ncbi:MAG TPA: glutamine amidotransferase, partial [Gemmataceae bacterium]|nr:glutamine amidotransferase [Gemmataceae bacterium]
TVTVHLLVDDKEILARKKTLHKTFGNEFTVTTDAPARAGEIKVTLRVDPKEGEVTQANNEISTFVTVTKEGLSVLVVDRPRFPEPQLLCDALSPDPRIRVYPVWLRDDQPDEAQRDLFEFQKHPYDVIILGDVSAQRLRAADPDVLTEIQKLVSEKGVGLLLMGGEDTFGNRDWPGTPLAELSPVDLATSVGQIDQEVRMRPTPTGLAHYIRVSEKPKDNQTLWGRLPPLDGMTVLGTPKQTAAVLAYGNDDQHPILVGEDYGKGRTLAFGGDTTWRWMRLGQPKSNDGRQAHDHFWRQVVLWLAQQDKIEGNVWIKPDTRRLATGGKLPFVVGLRGPGGKELEDGRFEVSVLGPDKTEYAVPTAHERGEQRGIFWKTERPGEYRLQVKAWPKGADPKKVPPEKADVRFIIYEDEAEMARRAADHEFLERLAEAGLGQFHKAEDFPRFVQDLRRLPLTQSPQKVTLWPDWHRKGLPGFLVMLYVLFTGALCLEWFLRRRWGLV